MTKQESKQARAVMEAWENDQMIEWRSRGAKDWNPVSKGSERFVDWNWAAFEFRVRPEPMEIEVWVDEAGEPNCIVKSNHLNSGSWTKKKFREVV